MRVPRVDVQMYKEQADHLKTGYSLRHGCAYVCWMGDRWSCRNDEAGWVDYVIHKEGPQKILIGREVYDGLYQAVGIQADQDGCFCEKDCNHSKRSKKMPYRGDMTWTDLVKLAERHGKAMIAVIKNGQEAQVEWNNFRDGRSDADVATALGRTTAEVTEMDDSFTSMNEIHKFMTNVAAATGNHAKNMRDFT